MTHTIEIPATLVDDHLEAAEPILSGWLTYPGDVRAGFVNPDGKERIVGAPGRGPVDYWDGRAWVAHEAELVEIDNGCPRCGAPSDEACTTGSGGLADADHVARVQDRTITTRVRFRLVLIDSLPVIWTGDDRL